MHREPVKRIILSSISAGDVHLKAVNYLDNGSPAELTQSEWEGVYWAARRQLQGTDPKFLAGALVKKLSERPHRITLMH